MVDWLVSLLVLCIVIAIVVVLIRWILSISGIAIPQPVLTVLGLIVILILILWVFSSGPFIHLGGHVYR